MACCVVHGYVCEANEMGVAAPCVGEEASAECVQYWVSLHGGEASPEGSLAAQLGPLTMAACVEQILAQAMEAITCSAAAAEAASASPVTMSEPHNTQIQGLMRAICELENKGGSQEADPRALKRPNTLNKHSGEEEATAWLDWKRGFMNFVIGHHSEFEQELDMMAADTHIEYRMEDMSEGTKKRSWLLNWHLAVYVEGRRGRAVYEFDGTRNGYAVWLNDMEPVDKNRGFVLLEMLTNTDNWRKGGSWTRSGSSSAQGSSPRRRRARNSTTTWRWRPCCATHQRRSNHN